MLSGGDASSQSAHAATALPGGVYTLGDGPAEQDRLQQQAGSLGGLNEVLLDRVGIRPGWSAVDLGCGPGGALGPLAARTGPDGHVTGVDLNPAHAATARDFAARRGLGNVQIVTADARRTGLPGGTFDVVHARLLMVNVPRPEEVAAEMARLAKPGGWVAALESDVTVLCYPPHPAVDRATALLRASYRLDGADPDLGRRLPHLFRDAGLADVGVEARAEVYPAGHPQRTVDIDLVQAMRSKIVMRGLAGEAELDMLDTAARRHLSDPGTLIAPNIFFLAWARKPFLLD